MSLGENRGVKRAYTLLFLLISEIVESLGTDGALDALERAVRRGAELLIEELRDSLPRGLGPLELGLEVYRELMGAIGAEFEVVERGESRITLRVDRCPYYEALLDALIHCGYFLEGACRNIIIPLLEAAMMGFDERIRLDAEAVRESAEGVCIIRLTSAQSNI